VQQDNNGSSASATQDTVSKQSRTRGLRPFVKGDPRINRSGRPKSFDQFRQLAQAIAHEKTAGDNGETISIVESILRSWAKSKEPALQKAFVEYAFGKVPDKVETNTLENKTTLILHYAHERPGLLGDLGIAMSRETSRFHPSIVARRILMSNKMRDPREAVK
jgi:hypothetical protein